MSSILVSVELADYAKAGDFWWGVGWAVRRAAHEAVVSVRYDVIIVSGKRFYLTSAIKSLFADVYAGQSMRKFKMALIDVGDFGLAVQVW